MRFNALVPELMVSDISKSIDFYTSILGFNIEYERKENKFAFLSLGKAQIMIQEANNEWQTGKLEYPFGRGINFQIEVNDVEKIISTIKKADYPLKSDLSDNWYRVADKLLGCREFLIIDPDGYLLRFSQNIGTKTLK